MFWALALCQSDWRNCGLCVGLHTENGATLSVGIWWRENKNKLVEWKVLVWLTEDCLNQVMRIPRLTVPLSHDSKPNPQSSKLVRNYWEKSRIDMFKELFRGSPLQFRGHDSIPASKTTSYDKTLDLWLCNTEAACMYATRLKLTTSHFLAFLIWKMEFDQTSLLILKVFENQRLSFKRLSTFFWAVLYQVAVVTLILCQILN